MTVGARQAFSSGLANHCLKSLTNNPLVHPISAEKVTCSWPEARTVKEAATCSHKSRGINIPFFKRKRFFSFDAQLHLKKKNLILHLKAESMVIHCRGEPKIKQGVRAGV